MPDIESMRLDRFLKVSRIIKRRTVANEACDNGRVKLNDRVAKAGSKVCPGDIIEITFGNRTIRARVESLKQSVHKEDAGGMFTML